MTNLAIIVAAGNSTRMNLGGSKMLLDIGGKTVIERCVETFENISFVDEIIVVAREKDIDTFMCLLPQENVTFAQGGATRQQSVKNAVDTVDDDCNLVLIHDGARPLVKKETILQTIDRASLTGAAAPGVPVKDTIKVIDENGFVKNTLKRDNLISVQTPQVFKFSLYQKAMEKAIDENAEYTDDCQLVENAGYPVAITKGDYENIKITTPDDLILAGEIVKKRN